MRISKFSDDQIHEILKELRRDSVSTVAQRHGVSQQTIYLWKRFSRDTDILGGQLEAELGEPLASDLEDFCMALYGAPAKNIIQAAVRAFIDKHLTDEPDLKKRFDTLQQERNKKLSSGKDVQSEQES